MVLALLLATVAAPGTVISYRDWVAGCDNVLRCEAQALIPDGAEAGAILILRRLAGGEAAPAIRFVLQGEGTPVSIAIDGKPVAGRVVADGEMLALTDTDTAALVPLMLKGRHLVLLDAGGVAVGTVSLAGAAAALLHIDAAQGRVGTVTALVRKGRKPASAASPAPAAPVVTQAPRGGLGAAPDSAAVAALRKETGCTQEEVGGPMESDSYAIDADKTLLLLACGAGAYNVSTLAFVGEGGRFTPAPFDFRPGWGESAQPVLVNATWERGVLGSFSKARGVGDCGASESYVWDGRQFRLIEAKVMPECKGSANWIRTWTAQVAR